MKFTVLGASGFIGSHLVKYLQSQGHECSAPARDDRSIFSRHHGCIIYCIGLTADFRERPFDTVDAHVAVLADVLQKARFDRIVYLSSTRLYDSLGNVLADEDTMLKFSPMDSRHLYDLSKALGENLCLNSSGGRGVVVRLGCVLGKSMEDKGFIPELLKQCRNQTSIDVDSSPHFSRDYIGIDDVVKILESVATRGKQSIYNVASGLNTSNHLLFLLAQKITGCLIRAKSDAKQELPTIDIRRIRDEFNFTPQDFESLLQDITVGNGVHSITCIRRNMRCSYITYPIPSGVRMAMIQGYAPNCFS